MKIGEKTLRKGGEMLTNAMLSYITKINEAFLNSGEMVAKAYEPKPEPKPETKAKPKFKKIAGGININDLS